MVWITKIHIKGMERSFISRTEIIMQRMYGMTFWLTRKGLDALGDTIGAYIYDEEE